MRAEELPALYLSADVGSNSAQKKYLWMYRCEFGLLVAVAYLANWVGQTPWALFSVALCLVLLLVLLVSRFTLELDKKWYQCRALAESVKTISWRFAMRAHPYQDAQSLEVPTREFLSDLAQIHKSNAFIGRDLTTAGANGDAITPAMLLLRERTIEERLSSYLEERVKGQRNWYAKKAAYNRRSRTFWFGAALFFYSVGIMILLGPFSVDVFADFFDPIVVVVTSTFAWLQIKRHGELAGSYLLTAHEIGIIQAHSPNVQDEESLSDFVNEAEFAFSREHTQWAARKSAV